MEETAKKTETKKVTYYNPIAGELTFFIDASKLEADGTIEWLEAGGYMYTVS